ncbi:hypothetical protein SDC9_198192 [bioreactor metagenome]|uniref:Uncharacterized protein n=1 Tax=bioreactor metagenome TaxID=1076179 RepID=A0A645IH08_9ZZZZ
MFEQIQNVRPIRRQSHVLGRHRSHASTQPRAARAHRNAGGTDGNAKLAGFAAATNDGKRHDALLDCTRLLARQSDAVRAEPVEARTKARPPPRIDKALRGLIDRLRANGIAGLIAELVCLTALIAVRVASHLE